MKKLVEPTLIGQVITTMIENKHGKNNLFFKKDSVKAPLAPPSPRYLHCK